MRHRLCDLVTPRALVAWAGTDRLSALAYRLPGEPPATDLARLLALLVAGDEVEGEIRPTGILDELRDLGLLDLRSLEPNSKVRARVSVLPLGSSLLVCDRLDAEGGTRVVCWPDDSSYHLARSIPPGRRARWLDIATGSAFAPLLRPECAESIVGTEINSRAVELARLGLQLSGLDARVEVHEADLTAGIDVDHAGRFGLITCNAPIPADIGPLWRATADPTFFERLFEQVPRVIAAGGLFVLHAELAAISTIVAGLVGERVTVSYVPEGGRQFGILWWRPDAEARHVVTRRDLTEIEPHLTHADRTAALG